MPASQQGEPQQVGSPVSADYVDVTAIKPHKTPSKKKEYRTDDTNTALWSFFIIYVCFVSVLGLVLGTVAYNRKMLKDHENDDLNENL
ncbi:hypothetical protein BBJ29_002393 [Phytophthora kernoviae]|uniref:Uncharacterized protein n=1 Tax=Phytophthora kernoviae TaxID=325452 RepID=A0A3F2RTR5_9STRA|nr:hypothetical protein BBP00_00003718 [Phytophthora kernoviae]RLN71755.1 hypothetical protein BBJ29_002393 [Phytophthora kernoviae]